MSVAPQDLVRPYEHVLERTRGSRVFVIGAHADPEKRRMVQQMLDAAQVDWIDDRRNLGEKKLRSALGNASVAIAVMSAISHSNFENTRRAARHRGIPFIPIRSGLNELGLLQACEHALQGEPDVEEAATTPEATPRNEETPITNPNGELYLRYEALLPKTEKGRRLAQALAERRIDLTTEWPTHQQHMELAEASGMTPGGGYIYRLTQQLRRQLTTAPTTSPASPARPLAGQRLPRGKVLSAKRVETPAPTAPPPVTPEACTPPDAEMVLGLVQQGCGAPPEAWQTMSYADRIATLQRAIRVLEILKA